MYYNYIFIQFQGSLPTEIGNLTNLSYLHIHSNDFSGII